MSWAVFLGCLGAAPARFGGFSVFAWDFVDRDRLRALLEEHAEEMALWFCDGAVADWVGVRVEPIVEPVSGGEWVDSWNLNLADVVVTVIEENVCERISKRLRTIQSNGVVSIGEHGPVDLE